MPDLGSSFSSGVQGALTGSKFGVPGAIAGGALGIISGIFSDSPEELARKRWDAFKQSLRSMKAETLRSGSSLIGQQTAAAKAEAAIGGKRRAISSGRDYQAESFMLPGISQAGNIGAKALNQFQFGVNEEFNKAEMEANKEEMRLPSPAQPSEYFDVVAGGVNKFKDTLDKYSLLEGAEKMKVTSESDQQQWLDQLLKRLGVSENNVTTITAQ